MKKQCCLDNCIRFICEHEYKYFLNKENVVGLGLGYKIQNGFYTFQKCIAVFVSRKVSENKLLKEDIIPGVYKGIITDVVETGYFKTCSLRKKKRPVLGGYSIGVDGFESGSMGCLVGDNNHDYVLTCNHVVAGNKEESLNRPVMQPSPKYGGKYPKDVIGLVKEFIPVSLTNEDNLSDAATVQTDRSKCSIAISFIGPIKASEFPAALGQIVQKVGSTSELTTGVVEYLGATVNILFLERVVTFKKQIVTTKMSDQGDSGSVLLSSKKEALGLLMSESQTNTIYNEIKPLLLDLNVHILRN